MPGPLMHVGAVYTCPHGTPGQIVSSNTRVVVGGTPVATIADTFTIAGCPFQIPVGAGTKPQPCVKVQWLAPAGLCLSAEQIPQGPPTVSTVQPRVTAT
jgi:hypothetical protein